MYAKTPSLTIHAGVWKINIDKRLHSLMRELTKRKKSSTASQYESAIDAYLMIERIPKQVERIERNCIKLPVSQELKEKIESLRRIAKKKRQPLPVLVEEILTMFLEKPENYLGKNFYEQHKRKLEVIK